MKIYKPRLNCHECMQLLNAERIYSDRCVSFHYHHVVEMTPASGFQTQLYMDPKTPKTKHIFAVKTLSSVF